MSETDLSFMDYDPPVAKKKQAKKDNALSFMDYDPPVETTSQGGALDDIVKSVGQGALQLPGAVTGLADIPAGLLGFNRPFDKASDALGKATGFQPGKWADETTFSPELSQARANVDKVWDDKEAGGLAIAKAYAQNPSVAANLVAQSVPSLFAGGIVARGLGKVGQLSGAARGALGEGTIMAGQSMESIDAAVEPRVAALTSLGVGAIGAGVGAAGGKLANRAGIGDPETLVAGGARQIAPEQAPLPAYQRVPLGVGLEAGEEVAQSTAETGLQNLAEGKPFNEGLARAQVEGGIAGGLMGGASNLLPQGQAVSPDMDNTHAGQAQAISKDVGLRSAYPTDEKPAFQDRNYQAQTQPFFGEPLYNNIPGQTLDEKGLRQPLPKGPLSRIVPATQGNTDAQINTEKTTTARAGPIETDARGNRPLEGTEQNNEAAYQDPAKGITELAVRNAKDGASVEADNKQVAVTDPVIHNDKQEIKGRSTVTGSDAPGVEKTLDSDIGTDGVGGLAGEKSAVTGTNHQAAQGEAEKPGILSKSKTAYIKARLKQQGITVKSAEYKTERDKLLKTYAADINRARFALPFEQFKKLKDYNRYKNKLLLDFYQNGRANLNISDETDTPNQQSKKASEVNPQAGLPSDLSTPDLSLGETQSTNTNSPVTTPGLDGQKLPDGQADGSINREVDLKQQGKAAEKATQGAQEKQEKLPYLSQKESDEIRGLAKEDMSTGYLRGRFGTDRLSKEEAQTVFDAIGAGENTGLNTAIEAGESKIDSVLSKSIKPQKIESDKANKDDTVTRNNAGLSQTSQDAVQGRQAAQDSGMDKGIEQPGRGGEKPDSGKQAPEKNQLTKQSDEGQNQNEQVPVSTGDKLADTRESKPIRKKAGRTQATDQNKASESEDGRSDVDKKEKENKIEDFGEVLAGANKHNYSFTRAFEQEKDVKAVPLSKSFPLPNYVKMVADGVDPVIVATIAQLRSDIKSKPRRKGARLNIWVDSVNAARNMTNGMLKGMLKPDTIFGKVDNTQFDVAKLAKEILPEQIKTLANYQTYKVTAMDFAEGKGKTQIKWRVTSKADRSGVRGLGIGVNFNTKEAALTYIKSRVSNTNTITKKAKTKFGVWSEQGKPGFFLGKKIASRKYLELKRFDTSKEARDYRESHYDELVELLAKKKKVRAIRRIENNPRVGTDYRKGVPVTPELFAETFGFRGVQFGNWVEGSRRQQDLNNTYDGLLDLADVLGIPPKALSLNGSLGLAFGARGKGGTNSAAAHFEPSGVNINITKIAGSGSLAHEFFHALDNYFAKMEGEGLFISERKRPNYTSKIKDGQYNAVKLTDADFNVRKDVYDAWKGLNKTIKAETRLAQRSKLLDKGRTKDYWSTVREMTARSFERYVIDKLADKGFESDYLANVVSEKAFDVDSEILGDEQPYPYPLKSEMKAVNTAYDKLFTTLKTKETDKGVALYSKTKNKPGDFVKNPDGGIKYGEILASMGREPGEIRLHIGEHLGLHKGYGVAHIKAEHGEINDIPAFVSDVTANFTEIWKTKAGKLMLIKKLEGKKGGKLAIVQLGQQEGELFYSVITSYITRKANSSVELLWTAAQGQPTDTGSKFALKSAPKNTGQDNLSAKQKEAGSNITQNNKQLYSKTASQIKAKLPRRVKKLLNSGKLQVVDNINALPDGLQSQADSSVQALYQESTDTIYLIAENLAESDIKPVLNHELFHRFLANNPTLKEKLVGQYGDLMDVFSDLFDTQYNDKYRSLMNEAMSRVNAAGTQAEHRTEELGAYLVELYSENPQSIPAKLRKLVRDLVATIKGIALRAGIPVSKITPADLAALARRGAKVDNKASKVVDSGDLLASKSATKSVQVNIKRGKAAMNKALLYKTSVHRAMFRSGMGWVDFVWGDEGRPPGKKGKRKGAKGISHIIEARQRKDGLSETQSQEVLFDLVETIAKGEEISRKEFEPSTRVTINDGVNEVILAKRKGSNTWVVTGYELHKTDDIEAGSDASISTRFESTPARNEAGAVANNIPQETNSSNTKFSKAQPKDIVSAESVSNMLGELFTKRPDTPLKNEFISMWRKFNKARKRHQLGVLSVRQLLEVAKQTLPGLSHDFQFNKDAMDANVNELDSIADKIYSKGLKLEQKDRDWMSGVAHEATIAGIDPAEDFANETNVPAALKDIEKHREEIASHLETVRKTRGKIRLRPGDAPELLEFIETVQREIRNRRRDIKNLETGMAHDTNRLKKYSELKEMFEMLSDDAKAVYREVRDFYQTREAERKQAIVERIEDSALRGKAKREAIDAVKQLWEQNAVSKPYFPLTRHGQFWLSFKEGDESNYMTFESTEDMDEFIKENPQVTINGQGKYLEGFNKMEGVNSGFVTDVDAMIKEQLGESPETADLRDAIYQRFLESLPAMSMRKHQIHRKNVQGFSNDLLRSFAKKSGHDARQTARIIYGHKLQQNLEDAKDSLAMMNSRYQMQQARIKSEALTYFLDNTPSTQDAKALLKDAPDSEVDKFEKVADYAKAFKEHGDIDTFSEQLAHNESLIAAAKNMGGDFEFASNTLDELGLAYEDMMNPSTSPVAQLVNSIGFTWFLGLSPAAALVNSLQVPGVSIPFVGAKYGMRKTTAAFTLAYKDFFSGKNNDKEVSIYSKLNKDEKDAYEVWHKQGLLDKTRTHDLMQAAEQGIESGKGRRLMSKLIGSMFHHAERSNREVTAIATYRLAREAGESHEQAIKTGEKMTWDTHLDYNSNNRARAFRGNAARVMTQFKQYSQGMTFLYYKTAFDGLKSSNLSKEEKTLAKKQLAYMLGAQFAVAGAAGLPLGISGMSILMALVEDAFDDEDEPFDLDLYIRTQTADLLGNKTAEALTKGVSAFLPMDIHSRLEQRNMWIRGSDRDQDGRDEAYGFTKLLLGPTGGLIENFFVGKQLLGEDKEWRGVEKMMPKAFRDIMKAIRYAGEDVENFRGDRIYEADAIDVITQSLGFTPQGLSERYGQNNAIKKLEKTVSSRRGYLIARAANAKNDGDRAAYKKALDNIKRFNTVWKDDASIRIPMKSVFASARTRKRYSEKADNGIIVSKRYRDVVKQAGYLN